ncbi:unnamed protein product [Rotaria socialis]|uniref:Uncharacterized protein n=2 Tax=Rotaria socialis TaxID=392032 RepID=A0A817LW43_9BILA|nr:unnamed protein product [Rotaria socialis]CAF3572735.1 unnamed protein product [Rotaria socialis]CAF4523075.1 unnamed protein product [Rotaria socialis]CAF4530137.1 unnamed protein product [Rotaria socialis]CAF4651231.1 unnamed protein product [Rotaria socialis]
MIFTVSLVWSSSSSNATSTKSSALREKENLIHSQTFQATNEIQNLANLLSCFIRIKRYQVDKDICTPGKNLEGNLELQAQAAEKEERNTTCSQPLNFDTIEITSSIH